MKEVYLHSITTHSSEYWMTTMTSQPNPPHVHSLNEDIDSGDIPGMSAAINVSEECSLGSSTYHCTVVIPQRKIQEFIIRVVQLKFHRGLSISITEDYLWNMAYLLGSKLISTKWNDIIRFLDTIGYVDPRHYKVCAS